MRNQEIAKLLYDIADLLEIKGEMIFKIRAYRRAAQAVESMVEDIEDAWKNGKLDDIPGVGRGIAEKIEEYLKKGKSKYLHELKKGLPPGFAEMLAIEGVGPKKVKLFYEKLGIKNVEQLERAAKSGKLRKIPKLKEKTEQNIIKSIEASKKRGGRMLLGHALLLADEIIADMEKCKQAEMVSVAGSLRRMKETIGDIDVLVSSKEPKSVIDYFTSMKMTARVIATGPTKASINLFNGIQVDLRVLPQDEYGSALLYFTGSKEHNIELRKIAIAKKLKLSEYGLFRGNKSIAGRTEHEVYQKLGLDYIEPEMRESRGEIQAAAKHRLPELIGYHDIKGDLQMHTTWSDGANTIEDMAKAAQQLGYEYICITDHAVQPSIANPLNAKRLVQQRKEIDRLNKKLSITILQGAEVTVDLNGNLGLDNKTLKGLDMVLASLHSALKQPKEKITERIITAMENPHVDMFAHPTARLIDRREPAALDMEKIIRKAKETGTILEIDAQPNRLDMNDANTKAAVEAGCKLCIDTDAHSISDLNHMRIGIATARRGWARKSDVINTYSLDRMKKMLK